MNGQESLGLLRRFKSTHDAFSNSRWLMGKFRSVIGILRGVMNRIGNQFSMHHVVASQLVRHYLPGFITMCLQQSFEKALSGFAVASTLQKDIDDFSVLIASSPQIVLHTINFHEYFIYIEGITKTLVTAFQTSSIWGSKLVAP